MSRIQGDLPFSATIEVKKVLPLDARQLVDTKADLTGATTWNQTGNIWLFDGAIVSVASDPTTDNNGVYFLKDAANYNNIGSWEKIEAGGGTGDVTGATNGLSVSTDGTTILLGGTLTGDTTFSGATLNYSDDYSGTYTNRSIPDVGYVTGYTQSAVTQNSNILTTYEVSAVTYTATTSSDFIGASGGTTIYLPDAPKQGQRIVVADIGGDALSDSITICSNTLQIVGGTSATINTDYGSITFINNGSFWSTAAFIN